jgi:hypothetical protein
MCPSVRRDSGINIRHAHGPDFIHKPLFLALFRILHNFYWWYDIFSRLVVVAHLLLLLLALSATRVRRQKHVQ